MRFPSWLPALLGILTAVGPISTDMYLPAFPAIEASLGGRPGTAQITLATWFAGLAIGQITQGTLSDRFGRRMPLVIGTAIYTLASIGCALAPDLLTLSLMRLLAAFGGSASMVIPRAIVRDLADGHAAARMMSRLMLVMGAAPILAPTLGGFVLEHASWHAIFWVTAIYGAVCCAVVWQWLPETLPQRGRVKLGPAALLARYGAIGRERGFITHTLIGGMALFGLFAYLGGAPDVFIAQFHLSPTLFGNLFGCGAAGYILASQINPRLLVRFGAGTVMRSAVWVYMLATVVMLAFAIARTSHWYLIALPVVVCTACMGLTTPNAAVGALSPHAARAGGASALLGTIQFCLGAGSSMLVGAFSDGTARPMALLMFCGAVGATIADRFRPKPAPDGLRIQDRSRTHA
jgi:DHA1 family bicyclomycin/chloramphenicol resistance-like MFS transporter